jgi:hypothetical protein
MGFYRDDLVDRWWTGDNNGVVREDRGETGEIYDDDDEMEHILMMMSENETTCFSDKNKRY